MLKLEISQVYETCIPSSSLGEGAQGSSAGAQSGLISLAVEIDTRWSYFRGEGLSVSRLSGGQEIAGSTPAIPTMGA